MFGTFYSFNLKFEAYQLYEVQQFETMSLPSFYHTVSWKNFENHHWIYLFPNLQHPANISCLYISCTKQKAEKILLNRIYLRFD